MVGYMNIHKPIHIDGDVEFRKMAIKEGWKGDGTYSTPYIIENLCINGRRHIYCISIKNTNVYFIIKNCILFNTKEDVTVGSGGTTIPIRHIIHNNVIVTPNQLSYFVNAVHEMDDETTFWTYLYDIYIDNETTNHIISCNLCLSDFINIYVSYGTAYNKQFIPDVVYNVCLSFSVLPGIIPNHYVMGNKMPYVITTEKFYMDVFAYARTHNEKEVLEFIKKEFCKFGW